jgi:hypothetical protein
MRSNTLAYLATLIMEVTVGHELVFQYRGHELVVQYRGYGVYFDRDTLTYWSTAGGNFETLTEALKYIDLLKGDDDAPL